MKNNNETANLIEVGKRYIWFPINHATKKIETEHGWCGHFVDVIGKETLGRFKVSVVDFPNCNHREYHNRFTADESELINIDTENA